MAYQSVNPYNGEVLKTFKELTNPQLEKAIKTAATCFETSAEVLAGLVKAFDDYENKSEAAWRAEPTASRPKERATNASRR